MLLREEVIKNEEDVFVESRHSCFGIWDVRGRCQKTDHISRLALLELPWDSQLP